MKRLSLIIHGRVQGVFYRASSQDRARQLGLSGWSRNLPDGTVELVAEGDEQKLRELLAWCYEGPPAARVSHIDVSWSEPTGELEGFKTRY